MCFDHEVCKSSSEAQDKFDTEGKNFFDRHFPSMQLVGHH